jgi:hypothetical protein
MKPPTEPRPYKGQLIKYHSPYGSDVYDGSITFVHAPDLVDVEINVPTVRKPWPLTRISYGEGRMARPVG